MNDNKVIDIARRMNARCEYLEGKIMENCFDIPLRTKLTKEIASLSPVSNKYLEYLNLVNSKEETLELISLFTEKKDIENGYLEIKNIDKKIKHIIHDITNFLTEKDKDSYKGAVLEIRAGTGGNEATIFASEILQMYLKFAENMNWNITCSFLSESDFGIKEAYYLIEGKNVYSTLKNESGVHRVQRVPKTENKGRLHTSAVSVYVSPIVEKADVVINDSDLEITKYRASGAGGQYRNTTDSAVRILHKPSGIIVCGQNERSQHQNYESAMRVLASKLKDAQIKEEREKEDSKRRQSIGSGDRSEKIRTYNFPENRVTDHRVAYSAYQLDKILTGEIDEFLSEVNKFLKLKEYEQYERQKYI